MRAHPLRHGWPRASALAAAALILSACSGETTPAGAIGSSHDLRQLLPADVRARAPADDAAREHRGEVAVADTGAVVAVRWRSFADGAHAYLLSMSFEVARPADGVSLEAAPFGNPENRGTAEAVLQAGLFHISWTRSQLGSTSSGTVSGTILANGTLELTP